jgi:hypothetical protein
MEETNITTDDTVLRCPITGDIMYNPVIASDGNTYERKAIKRWLKDHSTSPITRQPISKTGLIPNRAVKLLIDAYYKDNPNFEIDADLVYKKPVNTSKPKNTQSLDSLQQINTFANIDFNIVMNTAFQVINTNLANYDLSGITSLEDILTSNNFGNLMNLANDIATQITNTHNLNNIISNS